MIPYDTANRILHHLNEIEEAHEKGRDIERHADAIQEIVEAHRARINTRQDLPSFTPIPTRNAGRF